MPAGSKMDLLLAKAQPISNTSRIYLRRGKVDAQQQLELERGGRTCKRNNSADTKVSEEGGGGSVPVAEAEIPLQPMEKTMVRQAIPLQPMEVHGGADIHLLPLEDPRLEPVDT